DPTHERLLARRSLGLRSVGRPAQQGLSAVVLASIALAAYFQASAATELLGAALVDHVRAFRDHGTRNAPVAPAEKTANAILSRNPFDSVTGPLIEQPSEPAVAVAHPGSGDPLRAPVCEGDRVSMVGRASCRERV